MVKTKWLALLLVRLTAFAATLSAAIVMATSHQNASVFAVSFEAKYSQTPAFKYFVIANAIVSVYGFLVLFLPSKSLLWRLVVAFDLVIILIRPLFFFKVDGLRTSGADYTGLDILRNGFTYFEQVFTLLLSSSISAALAIAYVGKKGNSYAGWLPICDQVPKYCDQVKGALVAGFIGVIIYVVLLLHSIHTVLDPLLLKKP